MNLKKCFRCYKTDGLWIEDEPSAPKPLRYQVKCVCGLLGLPAESPEKAAMWWNDREQENQWTKANQ